MQHFSSLNRSKNIQNKNMMKAYLVTFALFALAFSLANASDPDPLQDFCVALKAKDYSNSAGTHFSFSFLKLLLYFCHVNHSF
jgi:hypothetical protein